MTRSVDSFQTLMADGIRIHTDGRVPAAHRDDLARRVCERVGPYGWTDFFRSYLALPHVAMHALDLPCLVVTGAEDTAALPAEGALLASRLPRGDLVELTGCGHFLMSERPEALRDAIEQFTTTHLTTGASSR
jgi:pimeloyl-ACP methyl ester carboxylesterase